MIKNKLLNSEEKRDLEIIYEANKFGQIIEKPLKCVMCKDTAYFIAFETNEPLCEKCFKNNKEAREKR